MKEQFEKIAQSYCGALPNDKGCVQWKQLQEKMADELMEVVKKHNHNQSKSDSTYESHLKRIKNRCTELTHTNTLRKRQIQSWNKFFEKLLKDGKITKEELKQYAVPKSEMAKTLK